MQELVDDKISASPKELPDPSGTIELFSSIDQYALREKKYNSYVSWIWLRVKYDAVNIHTKKQFHEEIKLALKCSDQKAARVLKSGMGIFWKESGGYVVRIGAVALIKALGLDKGYCKKRKVFASKLFANPLQAKAEMFVSAHPQKYAISRRKLQKKAGICKNTQIKYERKISGESVTISKDKFTGLSTVTRERFRGTRVVPQFKVVSIVGDYTPLRAHVPGRKMIKRGGEFLLVERRCNRYVTHAAYRRKQEKRLNAALRFPQKPKGNGRREKSLLTIVNYRGVELIYPPGQTIRPNILFDVVPF